jgi:hypothetical protein
MPNQIAELQSKVEARRAALRSQPTTASTMPSCGARADSKWPRERCNECVLIATRAALAKEHYPHNPFGKSLSVLTSVSEVVKRAALGNDITILADLLALRGHREQPR